MSDPKATPPIRLWFFMVLLGLIGVGGLIAMAVSLFNAGPPEAQVCTARPEAAAAVGTAAGGELATLIPTGTGRSYADLSFVDDTGRPMTIADFGGKPLLVNFWASWCIPCRKELPSLNALAAAYSEDVFAIVPVDLDSGGDAIGKAQNFLADEGLGNLPVLSDPSLAAFERLKKTGVALGLPATVLVDAKGCEIAILPGPAEWNSEDGRKVIDALIAVGGGTI